MTSILRIQTDTLKFVIIYGNDFWYNRSDGPAIIHRRKKKAFYIYGVIDRNDGYAYINPSVSERHHHPITLSGLGFQWAEQRGIDPEDMNEADIIVLKMERPR